MLEKSTDLLLPEEQEGVEDVPVDDAVGAVSFRMGSATGSQEQ